MPHAPLSCPVCSVCPLCSTCPVCPACLAALQVQIGDAQILPSFDSAHLEIGRVMQRLRREEVASVRQSRKRDAHNTNPSTSSSGSSTITHSESRLLTKSHLMAAIRGHNSVKLAAAKCSSEDEEEKEEEDVGLSRAIIVHIYSPLVPTLNLVDLPGLLPSTIQQSQEQELEQPSGDDSDEEDEEEGEEVLPHPALKLVKSTGSDHRRSTNTSTSRPALPRSNSYSYSSSSSSSSVWTGASRRSSRSSSVDSPGPSPGPGPSGSGASFAQASSQRRASFSQRQMWQSVTAAEQRLEIVERYVLSYPDSLYLLLAHSSPVPDPDPKGRGSQLIDPSLLELVRHYELQVTFATAKRVSGEEGERVAWL